MQLIHSVCNGLCCSCLLNVIFFALIVSWQDHASDIHQIIEELELKTPQSQLIGIGHSLGATATWVKRQHFLCSSIIIALFNPLHLFLFSILCEFRYPGSFDSIIALEPILMVEVLSEEVRKRSPMLVSRKRRDQWDSL
jgi:predicted esterase